ncbi:MAG: UDP-N-acetylmuramate dehydrogenase [Bacteroidota bacterium]|nr:UDP-N-acetylmuramate dehydrogenase [Bacteroidota bacterium]
MNLHATYQTVCRTLGTERVRRNVPLAPYTTMKLGGPADLYYEAGSAEELSASVKLARTLGVPFFLLGCGANVVVGDRGFRGLVIRNMARHIHVDGTRITAESGAIVYPDLIETAVQAGLSGLEHYVGIPSTVGGALWQNLHFLAPPPKRERTMFIEEVLARATVLTESNVIREVGLDYFTFGYDYSILHVCDDIVLSAVFNLFPASEAYMRSVMHANLTWRALRHPPLDSEPSVGSIFKKIEGIGAGRLIDECGLKGASYGDITVTHRHANIMINQGVGRAADLQGLIEYVRDYVARETGYRLETEIDFVGEFDPPTTGNPVYHPRPAGLVTAEELAARRKASMTQ